MDIKLHNISALKAVLFWKILDQTQHLLSIEEPKIWSKDMSGKSFSP